MTSSAWGERKTHLPDSSEENRGHPSMPAGAPDAPNDSVAYRFFAIEHSETAGFIPPQWLPPGIGPKGVWPLINYMHTMQARY